VMTGSNCRPSRC